MSRSPTTQPPAQHPLPGAAVFANTIETYRKTLRRHGINPDTEQSLLRGLRTASHIDDLHALFQLIDPRRVPTSLIPRLKALCEHPSEEVQEVALPFTLRKLNRRQGVELLRSLAARPKYRSKWSVYCYLAERGYRADVPLIANYVRECIAKRRMGGMSGDWIALCDDCSILDEFLTDVPDVRRLYDWIKDQWPSFDMVERDSFSRRQPYFGHRARRKWVLFVEDGRIGGVRLPSVLYQRIPAFGMSRLPLSNPRFSSAFRVFASEADVIVPIGDRAHRRIKRLWRPGMAQISALPAPKYEALFDSKTVWPRDITCYEWDKRAIAEDRLYAARFRHLLAAIPVPQPASGASQ